MSLAGLQDGTTTLHIAARNGHTEVLRFLLKVHCRRLLLLWLRSCSCCLIVNSYVRQVFVAVFFIVFMILLLACRHVLTVADGRLDWPSFASNHSKPTLSFCQEGAEADVATTRGETPLLFAAQQAPIAVAEA